jgi:MFS family permease
LAKSNFSFRHYTGAIASSNFAVGVQTVVFPWLIIGLLNLSPSQLGLAQMALLLPNLLFILPGGVVADGRHRGSWLAILYGLYLLPIGFLLAAIITESLSFAVMLVFAVVFGTISAFVQPARESLLGYTEPKLMHQAVAKVVSIQFVAQSLGFLLAGQMNTVGLVTLLSIQLLMFFFSALFIRRSHPVVSGDEMPVKSRQLAQELVEGFGLFRDNTALLHLVFIVFATGFLAFGVYLVGMPIIAREGYSAGVELYATFQIIFTLGIVTANLGVMRRDRMFARPGRLMIISFLWRGSLVAIVAFLPSLWILFPVIFVWGFFSGLSITLGRTILHSQVDQSLRSRAASVYQLCLFSGAPLGAWVCGLAIERVGLSTTFIAIALVTLAVSVLAALVSPLWHLQDTK